MAEGRNIDQHFCRITQRVFVEEFCRWVCYGRPHEATSLCSRVDSWLVNEPRTKTLQTGKSLFVDARQLRRSRHYDRAETKINDDNGDRKHGSCCGEWAVSGSRRDGDLTTGKGCKHPGLCTTVHCWAARQKPAAGDGMSATAAADVLETQ